MWRRPSWLTVSRGFQPGGTKSRSEKHSLISGRLPQPGIFPGGWKPALWPARCLPPHFRPAFSRDQSEYEFSFHESAVNFGSTRPVVLSQIDRVPAKKHPAPSCIPFAADRAEPSWVTSWPTREPWLPARRKPRSHFTVQSSTPGIDAEQRRESNRPNSLA